MSMPPAAPRTQSTIVPYWQRLPLFLGLPLKPPLLWLLIGLAVLAALPVAHELPSPWGWLSPLLAAGIALRQGFRVLDQTAHGHVDAAEQRRAVQIDRTRLRLPWKMAPLFAIWAALHAAATFSGDWVLQLCVTAAFAVLMPAMLMQLCASKRLFDSLQPPTWLHYVRTIGPSYLGPCVLAFVVAGAALHLDILVAASGLPEIAVLPMAALLLLYLGLLAFHLLGYLMYQYHEPLGLSHLHFFEEDTTMASDEQSVDTMVATRLEAGQMDEALALARNALRKQPENLTANERLYKLLITAGDRSGALKQAGRLLSVSLAQGRVPRALALYQELNKQEGGFELDAFQVMPLANAAVRQGNARLALELVRGFDRNYPGHADIPAAFLFSAQLLVENFAKPELAKNILKGLLQRYPQHELAPEARRRLDELEKE